ncbi:MAG TPA: glycosyltransferase [Bryobacteraceae bacterium]|nr:glycosyltransferase [Bryobacteraceae bacterium]
MLSPEAPYPLNGGGAYRTASLLHYFARLAPVDLIFISNTGRPALLPEGLVRSQTVIPLPPHRRDALARFSRNAVRAARGAPPLIDRLSGLGPAIREAIPDRHYDMGVIEHFWCAPYAREMFRVCSRAILNLHNVESVLHERCASAGGVLERAAHARFARASRKLEARLLPEFSAVLATSETDASLVRGITPRANIFVYPNALPWTPVPNTPQNDARPQNAVVFSGNFEYHPNIDAAGYLIREIWPAVRQARPDVKLRLVGRGEEHIRHLVRHDSVETTGPVEDALAEIAAAAVVIAPLRAGSGTRIKILEAWAAARPLVATTLAAEGLAARHGENCLIADNAVDLSTFVLNLLASSEERLRIGLRGRCTFEHLYNWGVVWKELDISLQVPRSEELDRYTE